MKKVLLILFMLTATVAMWAVSSSISTFRAFSTGSNITVEWSTSDESNLKQFELQRSSNNSAYKKVKLIDANGKATDYKYIDEDALLKRRRKSRNSKRKNLFLQNKIIYSGGTKKFRCNFSYSSTNSIRRTGE